MPTVQFIAHRGFSKYEKENTLASFIAAGAVDSFYGIETDVHMSKDHHFVLLHDATTKRVSNEVVNINVEQENFQTISQILLPDVDGTFSRKDLFIPEMIHYFKICKKYHKKAVLELKQDFSMEQLQEILFIIKQEDMIEETIFISFHLSVLIRLKKIDQTLKIQWLLDQFDYEKLKILVENQFDLDCYYQALDEEKIRLCHQNHIQVNIWTVDDIAIAKKFASWGVDYITTNALTKI